MARQHTRGFQMPARIVASALLLLIQFGFLFWVLYNFTIHSATVLVLSSIIGMVTVIFLVNRRGNPDHKMSWIIFILLFPIFGISVYLLWGGNSVMPHIRKKMKVCESHYLPFLDDNKDIIDRLRYNDIMHSRQAEFLINESGYPLYDGTSSEYLPSGERFFESLLAELENAQKYIYMEFFILAEGYMWDEIHKILKRKASDGVEIKIIFDDFGSIKRQSPDFLEKLKREKIEVAVFNKINLIFNIFMNNRNHRKIVVIDGEVAFTGGVNIGDEYINKYRRFGHWMDCGIALRGKAVKSFLAMFCVMWEFVTKQRIDMKSHLGSGFSYDDGFVIPYSDGPLNDKNPAEGIYMQILNSAQRYVYIMTPYLIIDDMMTSALCMAAKSGIEVCIVTPHIPDKWYVHNVTQYHYLDLLKSGVKIFEYTPGFIHSKVYLSDDSIATVGSVNMDYRSFVFHFESSVWIDDKKTALDIKHHFREVLAVSKEIELKKWQKRSVFTRIKQALLHLFGPFM